MKLVVVRLDKLLTNVLRGIAEETRLNLSDVIRDFLCVGIGYAEEMPLILWDPYGPTPFSKLPVDEKRVRISVWLDEAQIEIAKKIFNTHESGAIREAIRLGFRMLYADKIKIIGPDSELYPLKQFQLREFRNKRAEKALNRLHEVLER